MTIFRDDLVMLLPELRDLAKVLSDLDGLLGRHPSMLFEHRRIAGLMHLMPTLEGAQSEGRQLGRCDQGLVRT